LRLAEINKIASKGIGKATADLVPKLITGDAGVNDAAWSLGMGL
jgi:hypothetical protein